MTESPWKLGAVVHVHVRVAVCRVNDAGSQSKHVSLVVKHAGVKVYGAFVRSLFGVRSSRRLKIAR